MSTSYKLIRKVDENTFEEVVLEGTGGIIEIPEQYVRITDLESGIYRLTYEGNKYIYYNGSSGTQTKQFKFVNSVILNVTKKQASKDSEAYWDWYTICNHSAAQSNPYIYYGTTTLTLGTNMSKNVLALLESISGYVKNDLTYSTSNTTYALSAYQGYVLDQRLQALEQGGSGGATQPFIVTFVGNTADKTYTEIKQAIADGQVVIGKSQYADEIYQLFYNDISIDFGRFDVYTDRVIFNTACVLSDNTIYYGQSTISNGGGGGNANLTMPIIRMGPVSDVNGTMEISQDNLLTLTAEVIGGNLQVGDVLQLCAMRLYTYWNEDGTGRIRKYKMRTFCNHEVTEEDLGKRYIPITIENSYQLQNLLRGGGRYNSTVHNYYTKYMRIRREHPDNPDNALFSNAVPFQAFGKRQRTTTDDEGNEFWGSLGTVSIR